MRNNSIYRISFYPPYTHQRMIFTPLKKEKGGHKFLGFPFFEMNFKTT